MKSLRKTESSQRIRSSLLQSKFLFAKDDIAVNSTQLESNFKRIFESRAIRRKLKGNSLDVIGYDYFWTSKCKAILYLELKKVEFS